VTIHYEGKLSDGMVFDSSRDRQPLSFKLGSKQVIPGFDAAVQGMAIGDHKTVEISPEQAYGDRRIELIFRVKRQQIPTNQPLEIGSQLQLPTQNGQTIPVMIMEFSGDQVTLDGNHPLAGETLIFDVELLNLKSN